MKNLNDSIKYDAITDTSKLRLEDIEDSFKMMAMNKGANSFKGNRILEDARKENILTENLLRKNYDSKRNESNNNSTQKYQCLFGEFETKIYWGNLLLVTMLHIGCIYGIFFYNVFFREKWTLVYGLCVGWLGGFGVTGGAHRYWTHRSYNAKLPLKIILLICYSIAGQNTLLEWVRDHRVHHKFSETAADPHNSKRGFLFSHVGWLCMKRHPEVRHKGKTVDVSDIYSDPLLAFHIRYWMWFKLIFCFILPTIIPPYLLGESWTTAIIANCIVRYCLNLNFTWSVNSFAHIWGNRPYNRTIRPVENKFVSVVAMGEGWHNYHHSFPWDYRAAELGTTINVTTMLINIFAKIGWAYDLKTTPAKLVENLIRQKGDGTHTKKR